jgi:hypothetical protein
MALTEAIAHLNRGLDLVAGISPSAERDGMELDLRTPLGTAPMALKGAATPKLWDSLSPALPLATSPERKDALLRILSGLYLNVMCNGRYAESLRWVEQILDAAERYDDSSLLIFGHYAAVNSYFWIGDLIKVREHGDRVLELYSEEQHAVWSIS